MQQEKIHDYNGRDYRTVWKHPRAVFEDYFETKLARRLITKEDGWFIDIGGGYGRMYPDYKKKGRKIVLVDYAMNLLEYAEHDLKDETDLYLIAADAYHMPFKDNIFNGGISVRVMHHMNLPVNFLKEINRVMTFGSTFVMDYANKTNLFRVLVKSKIALQNNHEEYEPLLFGTNPSYFSKISKETGFKVKDSRGTGFFPRFITDKTKFLSPILFPLEYIFDNTLGLINLAPRTLGVIRKVGEKKENKFSHSDDIKDILACPICQGDLDFSNESQVKCANNHSFSKKGKIYDFRKAL